MQIFVCKLFVALLWSVKTTKIFPFENFPLYCNISRPHCLFLADPKRITIFEFVNLANKNHCPVSARMWFCRDSWTLLANSLGQSSLSTQMPLMESTTCPLGQWHPGLQTAGQTLGSLLMRSIHVDWQPGQKENTWPLIGHTAEKGEQHIQYGYVQVIKSLSIYRVDT